MQINRLKLSIVTFLLTLPLTSVFLQAEEVGLKSANLLTGWQNQDGTHYAALELILAKGWKTYWRSPGKTGLTPEISFNGSKNLKSFRILWPSPIVFGPKGMWSVGYKDKLVLPFEIIPNDKNAPVDLNLNALLGLCEKICVPAEFTLNQKLQAGIKKRSPKIVAALIDKPKSGTEANIQNIACSFSLSNDDILVRVSLNLPYVGDREVIMVEYEQPNHSVGLSSSSRSGPVLNAQAIINNNTGPIRSIERSKVRITVVSTTKSVNAGTCSN